VDAYTRLPEKLPPKNVFAINNPYQLVPDGAGSYLFEGVEPLHSLRRILIRWLLIHIIYHSLSFRCSILYLIYTWLQLPRSARGRSIRSRAPRTPPVFSVGAGCPQVHWSHGLSGMKPRDVADLLRRA